MTTRSTCTYRFSLHHLPINLRGCVYRRRFCTAPEDGAASGNGLASSRVYTFSMLEGKVAIVTGASGGIGQAAAILFSENGASVLCVE